MPAGNFNPELTVTPDGVVHAGGPFDIAVAGVTEMCVWVLQRDGADDAIANAMAMPTMPKMPTGLEVFDLGTPDARWIFPLKHRFKPVTFSVGSASAMATGVFTDDHGKQRGFFWSEPVKLVHNTSAAA
jgi:hypothetical protein